MGMEEDLERMFDGLNLGGTAGMSKLLRSLFANVQINTLKRVRDELDEYIDKLQTKVSPREDMNPFSILGVKEDATKDEVTSAYRKKSFEAHPDRKGKHEDMMMVNAAYEAICRMKGWK